MPKNLVIVESPAKAKTIEKYLGSGYTVRASMGHLRDLPKSTMGVDLDTFEPKYIPVRDKSALIKELKAESKKADVVYLATDPDREGEAISWHLKELLALDSSKARRVTFNEITKKVVQESILAPREIDEDLVNAQQARRVLDRIVGYELSPMLWHTIKYGLSAGRVQSVAVRMVVDREKEIRDFNKEEYWLLDADLLCGNDSFSARYFAPAGKEKKQALRSKQEVDAVVSAVEKSPFVVTDVKRSEKAKSPAPPFITSTLQQEASRRLNMTPKRTMMIAQQLYEGVDISGRGPTGLITYMRTDSLRLSEEAIAASRKYITENFGPQFCPEKARHFKTKAGAQDAHEAIRPTDAWLSPDMVRGDLNKDQFALYKLIWGRFMACQMANAIYDAVSVDVTSAGYVFRANYSEIRFKGFTALYEEAKDEESGEILSPLPAMKPGEKVVLQKMKSDQQFTQPPSRYTEATLIRALEEKGIGRPSTYASTVSTISSHDYVTKEGKYLQPTPLGETVTEFLEKNFSDIVDLSFTSKMESDLDEVESGKVNWKKLLKDFYGEFSGEMKTAEENTNGVKIKVPDIETDEICEECGARLVKKKGRFGYFLACPRFPECTFTKPIVIEMPGKCPQCGGRILKKTSRNGNAYYSCEDNKSECFFRTDEKPESDLCPKCGRKLVQTADENGVVHWECEGASIRKCTFITWDVPTKDFCPACGKTMFKRSGRGQSRTFCENEKCVKFVPLEDRGYRKKISATAEDPGEKSEKKTSAGRTAAGKTAAKKSAAAKTTDKKAAEKKTTAKKTAAGKTASSKSAAKKTSSKKTDK